MKIERTVNHSLILTENSVFITALLGFFALFGAWVATTQLFQQPPDWEKVLLGFGCLAFSTTFWIFVWEHTRFEFDAQSRQLTWRRRKMLSYASGVVPFGDIKDVGVGSSSSAGDGRNYRIVLKTENGTLPLTEFLSSGDYNKEEVAKLIRTVLEPS